MNIETLKEHLRVCEDNEEDTTLQLYLDAAIGHVRNFLGDLPDPLPDPVQAAVLLLTADLYENRGKQVFDPIYQNKTYSLLLAPYQCMSVI